MKSIKIGKQITTRETASLDKYLQEIGKIPLLTPEEEVLYTSKIKNGDMVALEKLTKANLRFVVSISKQYQNQGLTLSDLIEEGNLGLIKAAQRFDETRGFKFISFAVWWIRQSILQALADQSRIVRLPLNKVGSLNKMNKTIVQLEQKYERDPSVEEIAELLDIDSEEIAETLRISQKHVSVDKPIKDDEEHCILDFMESDSVDSPEFNVMGDSLRKDIGRVMKLLAKREADVISLYYGLNGGVALSLEDIGYELDLTKERVRQIKENAIDKLQKSSKNKFLKTYL